VIECDNEVEEGFAGAAVREVATRVLHEPSERLGDDVNRAVTAEAVDAELVQ
jgi:hypothetical protein